MEGNKIEFRGEHQQQSISESEIKGRGRRTHGSEQAARKLNKTQEREEGESADETEKEQLKRLTRFNENVEETTVNLQGEFFFFFASCFAHKHCSVN